MSRTGNNHYVPRFIIRNFIPEGFNSIYRLDCSTRKIEQKSPEKLFSSRRLLPQSIEDLLNLRIESPLAIKCSELINAPINFNNCTVYVCFIEDHETILLMNRFFMVQSLLLRKLNNYIPEYVLLTIIESNIDPLFPVAIGYIDERVFKAPLLLIDDIAFMDLVPTKLKNKLGSDSIIVPISPSNFLYFGDLTQIEWLLKKYKDPHYINLMAIQHQSSKCQVASHNLDYLKFIIMCLDNLPKEKNGIQIKAER